MAYAWRITRDDFPTPGAAEGTNGNAVGVTGPRDAPAGLVSALEAGLGERFRMRDDDGNVYYWGRIVGDYYDGFEPLSDFGMPNAGCTTIEYWHHGNWCAL